MILPERILNFIDGEFHEPAGDAWLQGWEPATGQPLYRLPDSEVEDLDRALTAARRAFPAWAARSVEERAAALDRVADGIEARLEDFAFAESTDNGKPLHVARSVDIPRAVANFRFFAGAIRHFASESHATSPDLLNLTLRQPIGIVGCISPWNLPLYLFSWKIAPALAAGNCVIGKPSEITPLTAALLGEVLRDSGFPPGVCAILHGRGAQIGAALCAHPEVRVISFTGGTATGAAISRVAAPMFKKLSLELGGKNPTLVFADADREAALAGALRAGFSNQGQICLCGSRLLVEASIYNEFRDALLRRVQALKVGDPRLPDTDQGALVSREHHDKVLSYIALAREEGGRVLCGGEPVAPEGRCARGWFLPPTLIEGLAPDARCNTEEIFGPVLSMMPFSDEAEALAIANGTVYGLASSLWTRDLDRAHRMAGRLKAGIVWINTWMERDLRTPFGGAGHSGVGREGGVEALRFFSETKNVCLRINQSGE